MLRIALNSRRSSVFLKKKMFCLKKKTFFFKNKKHRMNFFFQTLRRLSNIKALPTSFTQVISKSMKSVGLSIVWTFESSGKFLSEEFCVKWMLLGLLELLLLLLGLGLLVRVTRLAWLKTVLAETGLTVLCCWELFCSGLRPLTLRISAVLRKDERSSADTVTSPL